MSSVHNDLRPNTLSGRYRIEREIGAGAMATVYLARDLKHDRDVAVKILRADLAESVGRERFLREIHLAATLANYVDRLLAAQAG